MKPDDDPFLSVPAVDARDEHDHGQPPPDHGHDEEHGHHDGEHDHATMHFDLYQLDDEGEIVQIDPADIPRDIGGYDDLGNDVPTGVATTELRPPAGGQGGHGDEH